MAAGAVQVTIPSRVEVGASKPTHFSNDLFEGKILFLAADAKGAAQAIAPGRTFELQVQGRFKRPVEHFFMGVELTEGLAGLGPMKRGVMNWLFSLVKICNEPRTSVRPPTSRRLNTRPDTIFTSASGPASAQTSPLCMPRAARTTSCRTSSRSSSEAWTRRG